MTDTQRSDEPQVAHDREEHEECERGTVGCSVKHVPGSDWTCEAW